MCVGLKMRKTRSPGIFPKITIENAVSVFEFSINVDIQVPEGTHKVFSNSISAKHLVCKSRRRQKPYYERNCRTW